MAYFLGPLVVIPFVGATINVSIHKYNTGALFLEEMLPPQFNPCSKNYVTKNIWFCPNIFKRVIKILNIDSLHQMGDMT